VELLTTVAVMGILASLMFPALSRAQARAKALRCLNHSRQLALGMQIYAQNDPAGFLPGEPDRPRRPIGLDPTPSWVFQLENHLGAVDGIRTCPSDDLARSRRATGAASYLLNDYLASPGPTSVPDPDGQPLVLVPHIRQLHALPNPTQTMLTFEASDLGFLLGDNRTHPGAWFFGWNNVLADIQPFRHGGGANYVFGDGHVSAIPGEQLRRRIESGDNFALPVR
jgi:prepilin-type processing-associated H-X9-DG protein